MLDVARLFIFNVLNILFLLAKGNIVTFPSWYILCLSRLFSYRANLMSLLFWKGRFDWHVHKHRGNALAEIGSMLADINRSDALPLSVEGCLVENATDSSYYTVLVTATGTETMYFTSSAPELESLGGTSGRLDFAIYWFRKRGLGKKKSNNKRTDNSVQTKRPKFTHGPSRMGYSWQPSCMATPACCTEFLSPKMIIGLSASIPVEIVN